MKIGDEIYIHGYVDEIRNDCVIVKNKGGYFGTVQEEISEAIPQIDLREMDRWIPVSQQLPNDQSVVFVTLKENLLYTSRVEIAFYSDKKFYTSFNGGLAEIGVLAWMELPKPYKGGKE